MKLRNTALLVATFALLAGYVYFVEMPKPAEDPAAADKDKIVLSLGYNDLKGLRVRDGGKSVYVAQAEDGTWRIGGPDGAEASVNELSSVMYYLMDLQASRVITTVTGSLGAYGLEPPAVEAYLELASGATETLLIGDLTPQGSTHYAQRKGNPSIYLIPQYLVTGLQSLVADPPYLPTPTAVISTVITLPAVGMGGGVTATVPVTR